MATTVHELAEEDPDVKTLLLNPEIPHSEVAERAGFSEASVRRYRKKHGIALQYPLPGLSTEDLESDQELEDRNRELTATNKRLFAKWTEEKNKADRLIEAVYQAARDAAENTRPVKAKKSGPAKDRRKKTDEVALWHATDWQTAKVTDTFNSDIAAERVQEFCAKGEEITDVMRGDHPVRHAVCLITGDMLEGCKIFPGQEFEVDATLFEQVFFVSNLIEHMIQVMLDIYETIQVCTEWGNHGRIGKPSDGFKKSDNFDRIIYEIVRQRFAHESRITDFSVSPKWYNHFTVGEYSGMAIHGDEIKQFGGNLPAYGILRKANAWAGGVVPEFTDLYVGHFHQSMQLQMANGGSVYMTGSIESDNDFAGEFVAAQSQPSQRLNLINPHKGFVTYESRIWLT